MIHVVVHGAIITYLVGMAIMLINIQSIITRIYEKYGMRGINIHNSLIIIWCGIVLVLGTWYILFYPDAII